MVKSKKNRQTKRTKKIRLTRKKQHGKKSKTSRKSLSLIKTKSVCNKNMWKQNGCAHDKYSESACPLCRKVLQGEVLQSGVHRGGRGGFYRASAPIPGPIVGSAWNAPVRDWPSVDGIGGNRNFLAQNLYKADPQTMMLLGGKKKKPNRKNGGGLIPQDLINLGRDITYNMGSAYNALNGYNGPVNPSPYMDQIPKSKSIII
jgi:hypothetical protein